MNPSILFTSPDPNPSLDYVAAREKTKDRKTADYFAKIQGCKNGLKAWATGTGDTAEKAVQDALEAWEAEGKP